MNLPTTSLAQRATVRLIPTAYFRPPVLRALADTDEELGALAELEGLTSDRLRAEIEGLPDLDPRELAFKARAEALGEWGHSYINAAFCYTRPDGNRFNDADRGAWYCAFDELTAIEEVAFHRTRELAYIGEFHDTMPYQALLADFIGDFPDARGQDLAPDYLDPDTEVGYPAGQGVARDLRQDGWSGLIYPSVRRAGGTCFVAFEPQIIQNVRPGAKWQLTWAGSRDFEVTANP